MTTTPFLPAEYEAVVSKRPKGWEWGRYTGVKQWSAHKARRRPVVIPITGNLLHDVWLLVALCVEAEGKTKESR